MKPFILFVLLLCVLSVSIDSWIASGSLKSLVCIVLSAGFAAWTLLYYVTSRMAGNFLGGMLYIGGMIKPIGQAQDVLTKSANLQIDVLTQRRKEQGAKADGYSP